MLSQTNDVSRGFKLFGANIMSIQRELHRVLKLASVHLFACALLLGPANAAERETTVETGIDRPGGDYKSFDLEPSIGGFAPCKAACEADERCHIWTFVKSGVQGPKARCWLKDKRPPTVVRNNCCVSGVMIKKTGRPRTTPPPSSTSSLGSQVLAYAVAQLGKCVDSTGKTRAPCPPLPMGKTGEGECTHLVQAAVASVGGKYSPGSYVWGDKVTTPYQPGDIIQLFKVKLVGPNGWWETSTQHSAIIESVSGGVLNVIEQNTWIDGSKTNRRYVTRGTINLNWKLERGNYIVYRAAK